MANHFSAPENPLIETMPVLADKERKRGFWDRMINGWITFSTPRSDSFTKSVVDQERLYRARILGALFPLIPVAVLLFIPTVLARPLEFLPLIIIGILGLVALIFNKIGYATSGGMCYVIAIDAAIATLFVTQPHGIQNSNIPDFDLFIISVLIAGMIVPRNYIAAITLIHILIITALFTFLPHDPLLAQEIQKNQNGSQYTILVDAYLLQICAMVIAWMSGWSVQKILLRANQAEELADARLALDQHNQLVLEQNQRLEYGIKALMDVQSQVANGHYDIRARLQNNELVPLAISLNLMIERLSRVSRVEKEYEQLEQALRQIFEVVRKIAYEDTFTTYRPTGTRVDQFAPFLDQYYQALVKVRSNISRIEKLRTDLQLQSVPILQLEPKILQLQLVAQNLSQKTNETASPQITAGGQEMAWGNKTSKLQPLSPSESVVSSSEYRKLIEEVEHLYRQIQEINTRCVIDIKVVDKSFKTGSLS